MGFLRSGARPWRRVIVAVVAVLTLGAVAAPAGADGHSMLDGERGWNPLPILTIGETINGYTPPGVIDGLGAYELDDDTVRVLANHELLHFRGYPYTVNRGTNHEFTMTGARVTYFDIDKESLQIVDSGLAHNRVYGPDGSLAKDISFLANDLNGFSRFCSASMFEPYEFGRGRGLVDRIFMTGEEDGGIFNSVGGAEWALDPATGDIWHLPDLGRGAWENVTFVDTGRRDTVAVLLADDTSPFDTDGDDEEEAAPLFLYVGKKNPRGDFPARNGLRGGKLFVWVSNTGETSPLDFQGSGSLRGRWVEVDNSPVGEDLRSEDGSTGYDEYGYPTQSNLWTQAEALGAFGFSRPEDIATNPRNGRVAVLASTGVDTYAVDPISGDGADSFGTMYTIKTNFRTMSAKVTIIYDGDADPQRRLRSPDNLDWADDGWIYVQEDEAEEDTLTGEPLWGDGAVNPNEAGVVALSPNGKRLRRIANIDRNVVLDASIPNPADAVDTDAGNAGEWESSGVLDVSKLFDAEDGTLLILSVQAHGIEDQNELVDENGELINPDSRIFDEDLVEGGQLLFLGSPDLELDDSDFGDDDDDDDDDDGD